MPTSFSDHVLIVSCDEDKKLCTQALSAGHVHSSELLLTGVLRQELDTEMYPLIYVFIIFDIICFKELKVT